MRAACIDLFHFESLSSSPVAVFRHLLPDLRFEIYGSRLKFGVWASGFGVWGLEHQVLSDTMYLSISFGKSTPPQNRQLEISSSNSKLKVPLRELVQQARRRRPTPTFRDPI